MMAIGTASHRSLRFVSPLLIAGLLIGLSSCSGSSSGDGGGGVGSIALTPTSLSLTAGATGQQVSLLYTAPSGSADAPVTVTGLPSGVTISPSTISATPETAVPVTLTAAASVAAAQSSVSFSVTPAGQTISTQATLSLTVTAAPPPDFSFSVTPASVSLTGGGSPATVSLQATAQNGFSAPVQVAIAGLPAGVTAQPSPVTLTAGTAANLTFTASATAAAGTSTVTLTATSGSLTHTATVAITVAAAPPPQPDFTLALSPASLSITSGATGQAVQVSATAVRGFTGTVSVALTGLPAGVTANPSTLSVIPGTPQTVTLTAGNTAQAGNSTVVFTGTSGSLSHAANLALTVSASGVNVTTYHYDNARDGWYSAETTLTPQNVNSTSFGKLRELAVDGLVDAQPLYVSGLSISGQTHNVLLAVTEHGSVYAFDADTGTQLWQVSSLLSGETTSDDHGCSQITPEIGITATPVIDRSAGANGTIFFVAMSEDASGNYHQRLHALDLTTGAEQSGSPSEIQATFPGTGYGSTNGNQVFDPGQYAERAGLLLMNGQIYMGWTSHCDDDPYTGWVMAYSESSLKQTGVLNITPNGPSSPHFANGEGSIWMSGFGIAGDTSGNLYFLDSNGTFDSTLASNGFPAQGDFGNSFIKVSTTNNTLAVADFFAAYNLEAESDVDQDLGSGGAMLLPDLTTSSGTIVHLALGAGKDTNIYVVNRDNMGKYNASSNNAIYQELPNALSGGAFSGPALLGTTVYYAAIGDYLKAYPITNALLATTPAAQSANTFGYPGSTPATSSNGSKNGIIWAVENQGGTGILHAYDPTNLGTELYDSTQAANNRDTFSDNKFITPIIANGKVFVGTQTSVAVFGELQ
jgi:hypothetical protein